MSGHIPAEELSAFVDRDLEPVRAREIGEHLRGCAACSQVVSQFGALKGGLLRLGDAQSERDLWPAVSKATRPAVSPDSWWHRFWMMPVSATVGAAAALLIFVLVSGTPGEQPSPQGPVQALQAVASAELDYRKAISDLELALTAPRPEWTEETRSVIQQGLADIDKAIESCRIALQNDPADRKAQETMLAAYQHKVDFLTDLVGETLDK